MSTYFGKIFRQITEDIINYELVVEDPIGMVDEINADSILTQKCIFSRHKSTIYTHFFSGLYMQSAAKLIMGFNQPQYAPCLLSLDNRCVYSTDTFYKSSTRLSKLKTDIGETDIVFIEFFEKLKRDISEQSHINIHPTHQVQLLESQTRFFNPLMWSYNNVRNSNLTFSFKVSVVKKNNTSDIFNLSYKLIGYISRPLTIDSAAYQVLCNDRLLNYFTKYNDILRTSLLGKFAIGYYFIEANLVSKQNPLCPMLSYNETSVYNFIMQLDDMIRLPKITIRIPNNKSKNTLCKSIRLPIKYKIIPPNYKREIIVDTVIIVAMPILPITITLNIIKYFDITPSIPINLIDESIALIPLPITCKLSPYDILLCHHLTRDKRYSKKSIPLAYKFTPIIQSTHLGNPIPIILDEPPINPPKDVFKITHVNSIKHIDPIRCLLFDFYNTNLKFSELMTRNLKIHILKDIHFDSKTRKSKRHFTAVLYDTNNIPTPVYHFYIDDNKIINITCIASVL